MKLFSKISEYAFRALIIMEKNHGKRILVKTICREGKLPVHFTRKALQVLAQKGIVEGTRGPTGGYVLKRNPKTLNLFEITTLFENLNETLPCPLGHPTRKSSCPLCGLLKKFTGEIRSKLKNLNIAEMARKKLLFP